MEESLMGEDRRQGGKGGQRGYFEVHIDSRALYVRKGGFALHNTPLRIKFSFELVQIWACCNIMTMI